MRRSLLLATTLAGIVVPAAARAQDASAVVLRLPASTRALALGGAFPVGSRDSDGIFYNAAFGDALRGFAAHLHYYGESATLMTASGAAEWWGGTVGFGIRTVDYGFPAAPAGTVPDLSERALRLDGLRAASSQAISLAYARRVWRLRAAATAGYFVERRAGTRIGSVTFDGALAATAGPVFAGISVHDLGPSIDFDGIDHDLPTRAAVRVATRSYPLGPLDLALAAGGEHRFDHGTTHAGAGAEVSWWPISGRTFTLRAGVRDRAGGDSAFSAGAGFTGDRIALDWAWRELGTGATHRFGVRYR